MIFAAVMKSAYPSGILTYAVEVGRELRRLGHDMVVVASEPAGVSEVAGFRALVSPLPRLPRGAETFIPRRDLPTRDFDVAWFHSHVNPFIPAMRRIAAAGKVILFHSHGPVLHPLPRHAAVRAADFFARKAILERTVRRWADAVAATARKYVPFASRFSRTGEVKYLPITVSPRGELASVEPSRDFIFVGNYRKHRGTRAAEALAARGHSVTWVGWAPERVAARLRAAGVRYLGSVDRELTLREIADHRLLVRETQNDITSVVMFDAASVGRATVITNVDAHDEFIDDWKNGVLSDGNIVEDAEAALSLWRELGRRAWRKLVSEWPSPRDVAAELVALVEEISRR